MNEKKIYSYFHDITGQNGGLSKFTSRLTLIGCHFRLPSRVDVHICKLQHCFILPSPLIKALNGPTIKMFSYPKKRGLNICNRKPFLSYKLFEVVRLKKFLSGICRCVLLPCLKWQPATDRQLVNFDRPPFWPGKP